MDEKEEQTVPIKALLSLYYVSLGAWMDLDPGVVKARLLKRIQETEELLFGAVRSRM